jgi:hypothetical protein
MENQMTLNNKQPNRKQEGEPSKKKGNVILNPKKEDLMQEKLDPVGREDSDIDNDGKSNTKSDRYLHNRRKVRGKLIKMKEQALDELKKSRRNVPKGEGAVENSPEEVDEGACAAPEKSKVDDKEAKEKSKDRMKQKMMQMTQDFDSKSQGRMAK